MTRHLAGIAEGLVDCTLELYHHVLDKLLPTPSRFHYIFTARDLSRITQGLTLATPQICNSSINFLRQWRHECMRVLHDKLICQEDKQVTSWALEQNRAGPIPWALRDNVLLFGHGDNWRPTPDVTVCLS